MPDLSQLMQLLNSPNGLKKMMLREAFSDEDTGHTFSQADLVADLVNIMRMDTKRIAKAEGVDVEIERMTPERAAELLQSMAQGDGLELVEVFDEIEDQRMMVLEELVGKDELDAYMETKREELYSVEPTHEH
jgi:hypothetical protein